MPSQLVTCVCDRQWSGRATPPAGRPPLVCLTCAGWDQHTAAFQSSDQTATSKPTGAPHPTLPGFGS
jgi:hypothetical protein